MAATILICTMATPARLAGSETGSTPMPPRLVTNPWAEARRTWKSTIASTAPSTEPPWFCSCRAAVALAPGSLP